MKSLFKIAGNLPAMIIVLYEYNIILTYEYNINKDEDIRETAKQKSHLENKIKTEASTNEDNHGLNNI